jgi:hypothetical protein
VTCSRSFRASLQLLSRAYNPPRCRSR